MKLATLTALATLAISSSATANEFSAALEAFYRNEVADLASNQLLIDAVNAQNSTTLSYSSAMIEDLDQKWRGEVGATATPTITPVLENPVADFLRAQVAEHSGQITEIFVMDAQGLNVAASAMTSDYWQGDEAKHSETYGAGAGALHISDVELDESTQRYQGQISFTIVDPTSGAPIGAVTVGVDAESLM